MKRRRQYSHPRLGRDAERLAWLAQGLVDSGSRAEDAFWEGELRALVGKLLDGGNEEPMNQALDRLHEINVRAYEELADLIEAATEGGVQADSQYLLIALPVLAWSRYTIPAKSLARDTLKALRAQLAGHVLAEGAKLALADYMYSPDQLPRGFLETRAMSRELGVSALADKDFHIDAKHLPESGQYVSDVRYILGAIAVPPGKPLFRWNETDGNREDAEKQTAPPAPAWPASSKPAVPAIPATSAGRCRPSATNGRSCSSSAWPPASTAPTGPAAPSPATMPASCCTRPCMPSATPAARPRFPPTTA
jgi:hypothetical protein